LRQLLQDGRALGTALVWTGMFMNLMIYFFLQKWLTSLLVMVGLGQQAASGHSRSAWRLESLPPSSLAH
jgi:hypothetical protein